MRWLLALGCIGGAASRAAEAAGERLAAEIPRQFSAHVRITSHMVDQDKEYPPWIRELEIAYDNVAERAKIVVTKGLGAGKTFLRLYTLNMEYMIREGQYPACRRSYLGEIMPLPELPSTASFQGMQMVDGVLCEHWFQNDGVSRVHIYIDMAARVPRRLTEETMRKDAAAVPVVTYDFSGLSLGPQAPELFDLPEPYLPREACDLHVGGFPYLHLFHHYLRV
ncbi:unnamed protein product [Scytosiphon promiscuus]